MSEQENFTSRVVRAVRGGASAWSAAWVVLAAALVWVAECHFANRLLGGDFFEHAAVVRALLRDPLHPSHPLLAIDAPHAFFSPYALVVALGARVAHVDAIAALHVVGIINFCLFVTGLHAVVRAQQFGKSTPAAMALALFFCVFAWGRGGWTWSGFFHFDALPYVLAYPSTFAAGVTLWCIALLHDVGERRRRHLALLCLCSAVCIVTHPTTALALWAAAGAVFLSRAPREPRRFVVEGIWLAATLVVSVGLATRWPYFRVQDLAAASEAAEFDHVSEALYRSTLDRTWPTLLFGVPLWAVAALRTFRRRSSVEAATTVARGADTLVWLVVVFGALYALGAATGRSGLGRTISWLMLALQLCAASTLTRAFMAAQASVGVVASWVRVTFSVGAPVVLLAAAYGLACTAHEPVLAACQPRSSGPMAAEFIGDVVGEDDVVLADLRTGFMLPAVRGKIVASAHPLYWVPDHEARRRDVTTFFQPSTNDASRRRILAKYGVRFLLLDTAHVTAAARPALESLGVVVKTTPRLTLVRLPVVDEGVPLPAPSSTE